MTKPLRIIDGHARTGLFSVATVLLENMMLSDEKYDYRVELGSEYLYFDKNHGPNVWEYFFNQDVNTHPREAYQTQETGFLFERTGLLDVGNRSESYQSSIFIVSELFHTRIGFSTLMKSELDQLKSNMDLNQEYIAVHKRETDYSLHASKIHNSDKFFSEIESDLGNEKIFLATDSQKALWEFRLRYGSRLKYLRIPRSRDNTGLHFMNMSKIPNWRNGANAVLDCFLLANGRKLIRTRSNLTTFSLIINPHLNYIEMDEDVSIS